MHQGGMPSQPPRDPRVLIPRISVITATRNAAANIATLYESLAAQTYSNFEWLVADGLSSDGTVERLRDFAATSAWIRFTSEADFGLYHAINKAIATATGDYYVVAGADDSFTPDALANYATACQQGSPDVVLACVMKGGRRACGFHPGRAWIGHPRAFGGSHSVGMLFKVDLHQRFGPYSRRFPLLADGYFLKTLLRAPAVRFVEADFVAGSFAENGISNVNKLQVLAETWQIQMLTERFPLLQTALFLGKIMLRYPAVRNELRRLRSTTRPELRPQ